MTGVENREPIEGMVGIRAVDVFETRQGFLVCRYADGWLTGTELVATVGAADEAVTDWLR